MVSLILSLASDSSSPPKRGALVKPLGLWNRLEFSDLRASDMTYSLRFKMLETPNDLQPTSDLTILAGADHLEQVIRVMPKDIYFSFLLRTRLLMLGYSPDDAKCVIVEIEDEKDDVDAACRD